MPVATGDMVHEATKALPTLKAQGIRSTLVDLYSLPVDRDAIAAFENQSRVLTLEANDGGGFGWAVADALAEHDGTFSNKQNKHRIS